ncbi:hypothetical protein D805_0475 [Bifidobacterium thermophilum RBL67]|uniref:Uncharacterized protein n=1 Tax=Bifidobacterium thermophilum RBL67 TaxID=1254439 RepID=M4RQD6_9BIFI|nr:hypothetical protein D805_0475 [Bifidobacterium thermophilum RBL67]
MSKAEQYAGVKHFHVRKNGDEIHSTATVIAKNIVKEIPR